MIGNGAVREKEMREGTENGWHSRPTIYAREAWRLQTLIRWLLSRRRRPEGRNVYLVIIQPIPERCVACRQKQYLAQIVGASWIVTSR